MADGINTFVRLTLTEHPSFNEETGLYTLSFSLYEAWLLEIGRQ